MGQSDPYPRPYNHTWNQQNTVPDAEDLGALFAMVTTIRGSLAGTPMLCCSSVPCMDSSLTSHLSPFPNPS